MSVKKFFRLLVLLALVSAFALPSTAVLAANPSTKSTKAQAVSQNDYEKLATANVSDSDGSLYTVWYEKTSSKSFVINLQKQNWAGDNLYVNPIKLQTTSVYKDYLSVQVDSLHNVYVSWIDNVSGEEKLLIQKYDSKLRNIWLRPASVLTTSKGREYFINNFSKIQVDGGQNIYLGVTRLYKNGNTELYYQVINEKGKTFFNEGKKMNLSEGRKILSSAQVDLAAVKHEAATLISWVETDLAGSDLTINVQKLDGTGSLLFAKPLTVKPILSGSDFFAAFLGIEKDNNNFLSVSYIDENRNSGDRTLHIHRFTGYETVNWTLERTSTNLNNLDLTKKVELIAGYPEIFYLVINNSSNIKLLRFSPEYTYMGLKESDFSADGIDPIPMIYNYGAWNVSSDLGGNINLSWAQSNMTEDKNASYNHHVYSMKVNPDLKPFWNIAIKLDNGGTIKAPDVTTPTPKPVTVKKVLKGEELLGEKMIEALKSWGATDEDIADMKEALNELVTSPDLDPVLNDDSDNDGLILFEELKYGTNPFDYDTDKDGYLDGEEVKNGYNPLGVCKMKNLQKGNYAYGYKRLANTADELCWSKYLSSELTNFMYKESVDNLKADADIWNKYLNALIYGEYLIPDIAGAINGNLELVHKTMPFSEYRNTDAYIKASSK